MLDHEFKKQRARTVRELADKAVDPFIKKRLQDLAARYEDDGLKPPTKLTPIDVEFANRGTGARAISSITDGTTPASRARAEGKAEIMADSRPTPVKEVTATINGAMHYGAYFVKQSTVYVKSSHGIKSRVVREFVARGYRKAATFRASRSKTIRRFVKLGRFLLGSFECAVDRL